MTSPIIRFVLPFILFWLLVAAALFFWRARRRLPVLALATGAVVLAGSPFLFRSKWLVVLAVAALIVLLSAAAPPRAPRR